MLYGERSKEELNQHAENLFKKETISNRMARKNFYNEVINKFNMPIHIIEEMVTFKRDIKEFTPFEIFCAVWFLDRDSLGKFFTQDEIEALSKETFHEEKAEFPIRFNDMVQIADDQWIGKITAQQIMQLKRSRLLNYDENEQRALRRVKYGQTEIWKPFVSNKNVKEIKESMQNGTYVPDPITLNMPDGSEFSYENHTLTVYSLPKGMFNLDDGYHRYLAMSQIYDFDKSFDYPMELRVVNFPNSKANDFIFQQDQKTQMKRMVSETYDTNAVPNKIVARLNQDPACNIQGMIGRNKAKIDSAVMAKLVSYFYVRGTINKEEEMGYVIKIKGELTNKFNALTEQDATFLGEYTDVMLLTTFYVFNSNVSQDKYASVIKKIISELTEEEKKVFNISTSGTVRRKALSILEAKLESGG